MLDMDGQDPSSEYSANMQQGLKPPQETSCLFMLGRFNQSRSEIENKLPNKQTNKQANKPELLRDLKI